MKIKNLTQRITGSLALLSTLVMLTPNAGLAGALTPGNLVVFRAGDGSAGLNNTATAAFLAEYTTAGALVQTIALPTTVVGGNQILTCSGTATSEGFIARSTDGAYISCVGYNAPLATASITGSASTAINRVVGRVDINGNIDTTTALTDAISGGNPRSAVSTDGSSFWLTGTSSGGGCRYATLGATTSTALFTTPITNVRVANIFNGQLYVSSASGSGAFLGVGTVGTGLPTTAGQTVTLLNGMPTNGTHSSYGFWFKDASTLYVADDASVANGGGIQKWTFDGTTWSLAYNLLNNGSATTPCRGLTGIVVADKTILYATSSASGTPLITVTDTGSAGSPASATVLATAPLNTAFRGVAFAPAPALLLSATAAPAAGPLTTGGNDQPVFGFQLTPLGDSSFTTLALTTAGTANTSDLSNFEVVEDVNGNGVYDSGTDTTVSTAAQPLAGTINFTITGEGSFSTAKRFLVIADVSPTAGAGRTFTGSIAAGGAGTTPTAEGSAAGNLQTIGIDMTMSAVAASESATLSSLLNDAGPLTSTGGAQVWQVQFDNPAGNLGAGTISAITFTKGANNQFSDWSTTIQAAQLFDGSTDLGAGTVSADSIAFPGLSVAVPDGGSKTLSLRISLVSTPTLTDNKVLQFALTSSDVTSAGNGVITPSINSDPNQNAIDVIATKLAFTSPNPSTTYYALKDTAFNGRVQAQDANGNRDLDASSGVTVTKASGPGNFTAIGGPASLIQGEVAWLTSASSGFTFDAVGDYTLTATSDGGLTAATSGTITVQLPATLTEVILPQYMEGSSSGNNRLPVAYRATLGNLTPNATYRYYNMCVASTDGPTVNGAGNYILVKPSGNFVWVNSSAAGFTDPNTYGTFTTDGSGSYTGWFVSEPTGNARFATAGNQVFMQIILNNGADGTFVLHRLRATSAVTILSFGTAVDATTGTGIYGNSFATPKNFVMLYDNTAGTGRPLAGTFVEDDGESASSYVAFYNTSVNGISGAWGTIIPNQNANGVQRIESRALSDGSVVLASTDSDGAWPSGANTVNPTGGDATPLVITSSDAPLGTAVTPVTITSIVNNGDGTITISYTGGAGSSFTLLKSTDVTAALSTWSAVTGTTPANPSSSGSGSFTFTPAANEFYAIQSQ